MIVGNLVEATTCFNASPLRPGVLRLAAVDLPWQDRLCCESPPARHAVEGEGAHVSERKGSASNIQPGCSYRKSSSPSPEGSSAGERFQVVRQVENWA